MVGVVVLVLEERIGEGGESEALKGTKMGYDGRI